MDHIKRENILPQREAEKAYPQWQSLPHTTDEPGEGLQRQEIP